MMGPGFGDEIAKTLMFVLVVLLLAAGACGAGVQWACSHNPYTVRIEKKEG